MEDLGVLGCFCKFVLLGCFCWFVFSMNAVAKVQSGIILICIIIT